MAKPKVFLSSTCYDLSTVRAELTRFLGMLGFEVLNSEDNNFGVSPGIHSHAACLAEVESADYLLLIIGSKRGGTYVGSTSSITNEEYKLAEKLDVPRIVVAQRSVWNHRPTYKRNPRGDHSHIVDDVRVFSFIDYVASGHSDNWIHYFETIEDLQRILTTQFAHYLTLFSRNLRKKESQALNTPKDVVDFPTSLDGVDTRYSDQDVATSFRNGLLALHVILKTIITDDTKLGSKQEKQKQLWVLAKFGDADGNKISLSADRFKQYAWSVSKGNRVNNQFEDYNISAYYTDDPTDFELVMRFLGQEDDAPVAWVLSEYAKHLIAKYGEDFACNLFTKADMRIYSE